MPKTLTLTQLLEALRTMCEQSTQKDVAAQVGISQSYLNDVLQGHRMPGQKILDALKLRQLEPRYERIADHDQD